MERIPSSTKERPKLNNRLGRLLPQEAKDHLVGTLSEFAGTFLFLLLAFGGTNAVNNAPAAFAGQPDDLSANPAKLLFISLSFGGSLAVNAWVFYRISGGMFNPAVTVGLVLIGAVNVVRGVLAVAAQLLGAIAASAVVLALFPGGLKVTTSLGGGASVAQVRPLVTPPGV